MAELTFQLTNLSSSFTFSDLSFTLLPVGDALTGTFTVSSGGATYIVFSTGYGVIPVESVPGAEVACGFTVTSPNSRILLSQISARVYSELDGNVIADSPLEVDLHSGYLTLGTATKHSFRLPVIESNRVPITYPTTSEDRYFDIYFRFELSGVGKQTIGLAFNVPVSIPYEHSKWQGASGNDYSPIPDEFWEERQKYLEKTRSETLKLPAPTEEFDEEYMRKNAELEAEIATLKSLSETSKALSMQKSLGKTRTELKEAKAEISKLASQNAELLQNADAYNRFLADSPQQQAEMTQQIANMHEQMQQMHEHTQQITQQATQQIQQLQNTIQQMQPELEQHHQMMANPIIQAVMQGDWNQVKKSLEASASNAQTPEEFLSALQGLNNS